MEEGKLFVQLELMEMLKDYLQRFVLVYVLKAITVQKEQLNLIIVEVLITIVQKVQQNRYK